MKNIKYIIVISLALVFCASCPATFGSPSFRGSVFIQIPNEVKANTYTLIEESVDPSYNTDASNTLDDLDDSQKAVQKSKHQEPEFHTFLDSADCVIKHIHYIGIGVHHRPKTTEVKYTLTLSYNDSTKTPIVYEFILKLEDKSMPKEEAIPFEFKEVGGTRTLKGWIFGRIVRSI